MTPRILDVCCGPRMFWHDPHHPGAVYIDKRAEVHKIDIGSPHTIGRKDAVIAPDIKASFTNLPFKSDHFDHVVFDPPHIRRERAAGIFTRKYGFLTEDWRGVLSAGFRECLRVLRDGGTLIFKWADTDTSLAEVLDLCPISPLYGHRSGKAMHTHWVAFLKDSSQLEKKS